MVDPVDVRGRFEEVFAPVVAAFADSVDDPGAGGAALSVWHDGREVLDVHAGVADVRTGRRWEASTPTVLFSATKGLAALAVAHLADQRRLDIDAPVADVWPEFGRPTVTIGDVLAHRAGLPAPEADLSVDDLIDLPGFAARLAAQKPLWSDAEAHLYHALTWGPLVSEIVRRATGEDVPDVFAREIAGPLGAAVTLRAGDADVRNVAYVTQSPLLETLTTQTIPLLGADAVRALTAGGALPVGLVGDGTGLNDSRIQRSGLLSASGIGTASGLARTWSATVASPNALCADAVRRLTAPRSEGPGFTDGEGTGPFHRWGAGVQLASGALRWLGPRSFGHDGAGGQAGFADPDHRVGVGYVTNRLVQSAPIGPIVDALRTVL